MPVVMPNISAIKSNQLPYLSERKKTCINSDKAAYTITAKKIPI